VRPIRWTEEAAHSLKSLRSKEQMQLLERLELLVEFPKMYPVRQRGRFSGMRYFMIGTRWITYYRLETTGAIMVFDVIPALQRAG